MDVTVNISTSMYVCHSQVGSQVRLPNTLKASYSRTRMGEDTAEQMLGNRDQFPSDPPLMANMF